jgi:PleD family two-component response regulator
LPEVTAKKAVEIAGSVRKDVYELGIEHKLSKVEKVVTVSVGVAAIVPSKEFNPTDFDQTDRRSPIQSKSRRP